MTALHAKQKAVSSSEGNIYEAFLAHNYPQFMANYRQWKSIEVKKLGDSKEESQRDSSDIYTLSAINSAFTALFSEEEILNNFPSDH